MPREYNFTQDNSNNAIYIVYSFGYNYSKLHRAFQTQQDAEAFRVYFERNSLERAYIQQLELE